jgi:16S rRNA (guanine527-N7)-methyltransferase
MDLPTPRHAADLGAGGGLPGLVLAFAWPETVWWFVEANARRAGFLRDAVRTARLDDRVEVLDDRAEVLGHSDRYRGRCDLVVARSFAPPAVTAECAAGLLVQGGALIVSDPPAGTSQSNPETRWPPAGLAPLGLRLRSVVSSPERFAVLVQERPCPDRFPRRVGVPGKRPLF